MAERGVPPICGVLAVVALTLALIGVWARATVFDSDEVGEIVSAALADPEVTAGLATWVTDEVFTAVDVEVGVERRPAGPARSAGSDPDSGRPDVRRPRAHPGARQPRCASRRSPQAVERAHSALMQLLSGDGLVDGITVDDGAVTVNLLPLVSAAA